MEEDESMRALASSKHTASTSGGRTRDIVPRTPAGCTSPGSLKNKFRNILVGGMRDVSAERVVRTGVYSTHVSPYVLTRVQMKRVVAEATPWIRSDISRNRCGSRVRTSPSDVSTVSKQLVRVFLSSQGLRVPLARSNFHAFMMRSASQPGRHLQSFSFTSQVVCSWSYQGICAGGRGADPGSADGPTSHRRVAEERSTDTGVFGVRGDAARKAQSLTEGKPVSPSRQSDKLQCPQHK